MRIPTAAESADVLEYVEIELSKARETAAACYGCAAALAELRSLALEFASRLRVHVLTADHLASAPKDEQERARLASLITRSFPIPTNDEGTTSNGHQAP